MKKLFIATPAYDGGVKVPYAVSLAETYALLTKNGIECVIRLHTSGSLLVAERNRLNKAFLETDCTHMLCIDADLGWPAQAVLAMLNQDKDFIAGVYPTRREDTFLFRPVFKEDGSVVTDGKNLLKMEYIPAGFMLIKREVIEKMHQHFADLYFKPKAKENEHMDGFCLFDTEIRDGEFWGEDYVFCRRAREAGFEIWVDPYIEFDHHGVRGMLVSVLSNKKDEKV
jgi:hypothetical protein